MDAHHMSILQIVIDHPVCIVLVLKQFLPEIQLYLQMLHIFSSSSFLTRLLEVFPFVFLSLVYLGKKRGCQSFYLLVKLISVLLE